MKIKKFLVAGTLALAVIVGSTAAFKSTAATSQKVESKSITYTAYGDPGAIGYSTTSDPGGIGYKWLQ